MSLINRVLCFVLLTVPLYSAPPELTPHRAKALIHKILAEHAKHKTLSKTIAKRSLTEFIDLLDPSKSCFLEGDVQKWINPSDETLKGVLQEYRRGSFSSFSEVYDKMLLAIKRRKKLEKRLKPFEGTLPDNPSSLTETFPKNENDLLLKLSVIQALQEKAASELDDLSKESFFSRLEKYRNTREEELFGDSLEWRKKHLLSLVLKATTQALDSHTMYFTPQEMNQFLIEVQQRLFGIGAQLRDDLNGFTIVHLLEGGPAIRSKKIKEGDKIIAVNGEPVIGLAINDAVEKIRGPEGTNVTLTLLREEETKSETFDMVITRQEIVFQQGRIESRAEPFGDGFIGYIHLHSFYQDAKNSSASDLKERIQSFQKEGKLLGLILDLRTNGGGFLPQAVSVSSLFVKKGIIASVQDSNYHLQHLRNLSGQTAWDGPLIILTNRASASASEIVAQSLQDYGRALIVGDPETFGKGTYQNLSILSAQKPKVNPAGEYKVTKGMYYTVSGKSPQYTGVKADIHVPGPLSSLDIGERFSKYPLQSDKIAPSFEDDLSDIPPFQRSTLKRFYQNGLQKKLTTYTKFLNTLSDHSQERIAKNDNYQNFLKALDNKQDKEAFDSFGQNDLQLEETFEIMKDLIILMNRP